MVVKKYFIFLSILFVILLSNFCFAATLTPINSMTLEQAQNFEIWLETIFEGQDLSAAQIRTAWNNFSFDSNVEYLENMVFFRSKSGGGGIALRAIPNNNTISDSIDNITISVTSSAPSGLYLKYRTTLNSNDITITKSVNLTCSNNILTLTNNTSTSDTTGNCGYFFLNGTTLNYNDDLSILISSQINTFCKTPALYVRPYGTSTYYVMGISQNMAVEEDTGGESGGEGGEDTGGGSTTTPDYSEDLDNIQGSIDDVNTSINNQGQAIIENQNQNTEELKQEIGNINENLTTVPDLEDKEVSGEDITNNFNFEFMEDPYSNFWFELITGVGSCLTDNVRTFNINWLGYETVFNLDNWGSFYPSAIEFILSSVSTIAIVWVMVKWWKIIVDNLTSGNIDEVLSMNEEEGIINLF